MSLKRILTAGAAVALMAGAAIGTAERAAAQDACDTVRLEQVNWTGVSAKTETLAWILQQLGYETDLITASVPIMFNSLAKNERDAFLGLWLPTQKSMIQKYMKEGSIDLLTANLDGAKYTVAVTQAAHEAGVQHFSDLDEHKDKFNGTIYGIEAGNDGNQIIKDMIADDAYGLGDWELLPSSEAGMLTQVQKDQRQDKWAAFLGWEPHPMNLNIDMAYLAGGEDYWGPNKGGATVYTLTRTGYGWECPNVGQLLQNYSFTLDEQNLLGKYVINDEMTYLEAGQRLIEEKPELLNRWFDRGGPFVFTGVTTKDGGDATAAVKSALGIN
jgi:glycine betaine/proline transport system substrate-binding protein